MLPAKPKDAPRELKPGDLYVMLGNEPIAPWDIPIVGQIQTLHGHRMRLVERHPCGALEFLILPISDEVSQ